MRTDQFQCWFCSYGFGRRVNSSTLSELKMEPICFSETLSSTDDPTRCQNLEQHFFTSVKTSDFTSLTSYAQFWTFHYVAIINWKIPHNSAISVCFTITIHIIYIRLLPLVLQSHLWQVFEIGTSNANVWEGYRIKVKMCSNETPPQWSANSWPWLD
jgi:hypothetical protein